MTEREIDDLVESCGFTAALVKSICRRMGWVHRSGDNGAPPEWHDAYAGWLGDALERAALRRSL